VAFDPKYLFALASALCGFSFYCLIIISIIRKRTSPSRTTWLIWWVNDCLIFCSSFASGARNTSWLPGVYVLMGFFAFLASIKNDSHSLSKVDLACLSGAIFGWTIWELSNNAIYGLIVGVAVNTIGAIPTCKRALSIKSRQDITPWVITTCGGVCSILSAEKAALGVLLFPINSFCVSSTITLLLLYCRLKNNRAAQET
jgi:hypothetical protein